MAPTLRLKKLALENFGPFVGRHVLDLPESGLHMVLGENQDTDESSGAGKSSFVESLAYAFDYSDFAATDLQSWPWLTDEPLSVCVDFSCPSGEVEYVRSKKAQLRVAGAQPVLGASSVKDELRRVVGLRPEVLKALTYRPQGKPGLFLSMSDSEKKSFLTELLGLQTYEVEADRIVKLITELEQKETIKKAVYQSALEQAPSQPTPPTTVDTSELDSRLGQLQEEIESANSTYETLKKADSKAVGEQAKREREVKAKYEPLIGGLEADIAKIKNSPIDTPPACIPDRPSELTVIKKKLELLKEATSRLKIAHQDKLKVLRKELEQVRDSYVSSKSKTERLISESESTKNRVSAEVVVLEKMICDRCERPWSDDKYALILSKKRKEIEDQDVTIADAKTRLGAIETKGEQARTLALTIRQEESVDPVPEKLKVGESEFAQKLADLEATYRSEVLNVNVRNREAFKLAEAVRQKEIAEVRTSLANEEKEYRDAMALAQTMTEEHAQVRESLSSSKELLNGLVSDRRLVNEKIEAAQAHRRYQIAQFEREMATWSTAMERVAKVKVDYEQIQTETDRERDYLGCIRSFLGMIFYETLDRIAFLTNQRLSRVPNVQGITLKFDTERETKTTKQLRQEIRVIIEKDGHEIPLKRLSGGMNRAVELGVDLSLSDVISERTGINPGWAVFDESLDGLSLLSKTACLELLREASKDRLILVIEHTTELRDMFHGVVNIRNQDGRANFG